MIPKTNRVYDIKEKVMKLDPYYDKYDKDDMSSQVSDLKLIIDESSCHYIINGNSRNGNSRNEKEDN